MREALLSAANYSELLQLKIIHKVKMMNFKKLRNSLAEELVESTALYEEMSIPPQPNAPPSESIIRFINLGTIAEYSIVIISLVPFCGPQVVLLQPLWAIFLIWPHNLLLFTGSTLLHLQEGLSLNGVMVFTANG